MQAASCAPRRGFDATPTACSGPSPRRLVLLFTLTVVLLLATLAALRPAPPVSRELSDTSEASCVGWRLTCDHVVRFGCANEPLLFPETSARCEVKKIVPAQLQPAVQPSTSVQPLAMPSPPSPPSPPLAPPSPERTFILIQATRERDPYIVIGEFGGDGVVVRVGEVSSGGVCVVVVVYPLWSLLCSLAFLVSLRRCREGGGSSARRFRKSARVTLRAAVAISASPWSSPRAAGRS
jgi:hypothetical protein